MKIISITDNMTNKLKNTFRKLFCDLSILADSSDSSVSLSEELLSFVRDDLGSIGKVAARIVENVDGKGFRHYFIEFSPWKDDSTTYSSVLARNDFYDSIGFETLVPTVNYIFYYYGIKDDVKRLRVKPVKIGGKQLYKILRP